MPNNCPTKHKLSSIALSFSLLTLLSFTPIQAQELNLEAENALKVEDLTIVVSPPRTNIEAEPGDIIQKSIKITNNTENGRTVDIKATIIDYIVTDNIGTPVKVSVEGAGNYLASPWMSLDRNTFTLEAKQSEVINVVIQVPENALAGGHYAGIFFEPTDLTLPDLTVSQTVPQVGSLFAINIAGDINYDAVIEKFETSSRFYEFGPVDFLAEVQNQSDTHIRPTTSISITNMFGKKVTELTPDEVNIFPFTSRIYTSTWEQIWGFGKYEATLKVPFGPQGNIVEATIFFWILPYRLIAAIIIALLVLIALFISIRRHIHHRLDNRDNQIDELKRKIVELENKSSKSSK